MRRGIALFLTLAVITLVSVLLMRNMSNSTKALNSTNSPAKMMQTYQIIKDMTKFISDILPQVDSKEKLSALVNGYVLPFDDIYFDIKVNLLSNKININYILSDRNNSASFEQILNFMFEYLEVSNPSLLLGIMRDTIDLDLIRRDTMSEIAYRSVDTSQGKIYNKNHFNKIIKRYFDISDDDMIKNINFDELFYFGDSNSTYPLFNVLHSEKLDKALEYVDDMNSDLNVSGLLDIQPFSEELINNMLLDIDVQYKIKDTEGSFEFWYDTKSKQIVKLLNFN